MFVMFMGEQVSCLFLGNWALTRVIRITLVSKNMYFCTLHTIGIVSSLPSHQVSSKWCGKRWLPLTTCFDNGLGSSFRYTCTQRGFMWDENDLNSFVARPKLVLIRTKTYRGNYEQNLVRLTYIVLSLI